MLDISLPEEILHIIWKQVYSNNVVSSISKQAHQINKKLKYQSNDMMIYAMDYNVLRIMSGMGGLSYST